MGVFICECGEKVEREGWLGFELIYVLFSNIMLFPYIINLTLKSEKNQYMFLMNVLLMPDATERRDLRNCLKVS